MEQVLQAIRSETDLEALHHLSTEVTNRIKELRSAKARDVKSAVRPGQAFMLSGLSPRYTEAVVVEATGAPCGGNRVAVKVAPRESQTNLVGYSKTLARYGSLGIKVPASSLVPIESERRFAPLVRGQ